VDKNTVLKFANTHVALQALQSLSDILHDMLAETQIFLKATNHNYHWSFWTTDDQYLTRLCHMIIIHHFLYCAGVRVWSIWITLDPPKLFVIFIFRRSKSLVPFNCIRSPNLLNTLHFNQNKLQNCIGIFGIVMDFNEQIETFCK
jgi:hypothetical protein